MPKLEAAAQSAKADQGHWHSAFQKAKNVCPVLRRAFKEMRKNSPAQFLHSEK
jgi:hypothetical protein